MNNVDKPIVVITVTFSPGEYLVDFLRSIPAATTRPTRVYLADNGSTDGVPQQAAADYDNVEFLPTGGNVGYGAAINYAAKQAQQQAQTNAQDTTPKQPINPEFFIIANPDVVFDPGSIDELIECARRWPKAASIGPYIRQSDGSAYPSARAIPTLRNGIGHALFSGVWTNNPWSRSYRDNQAMDQERVAGWLSGSCLLIRWDAFNRIGGFDERYFMYMEDVDLGDRFGRAGFVNVLCPTAQITHAVGHSAGKHPEKMLPAHHDSAYRFQADRHPHWWQAPIRLGLWLGLKVRAAVVVGLVKMKK
ncbi:MAG: glycosyltransferase family 2 protein [Corynebacterium sp.]|nr:glycosyltransferase family 2 protein [Corynebacterium sp.]